MSFSFRFGLASIAVSMIAMHCEVRAQEGTRNGALLGGAAGAVIGGIIGNNKNDQTAEGALIGGAVGAVTGGLIGRHRDQVAEQQRAAYAQTYPYGYRTYPAPRTYYPNTYPQPHRPTVYGPGQPTIVYSAPVVTRHGVYRSPSRAAPQQPRRPVTMQDVIHMTRNRVSDNVIVSHIQANGMALRPTVDDVVILSQEGVSDFVITAMQNEGAVDVIVEPNVEPTIPSEHEVRSGELVPVPPLRGQRRGF